MAVGSQAPQEYSVKGRVKCTPLQGIEHANRRAGVPSSTPKYNNLEEWFQDVSPGHPLLGKQNAAAFGCFRYSFTMILIKEFSVSQNFESGVLGETKNVEVVREFYTCRPTPKSDVEIWYADKEFGFYEALPKRVADIHATHVILQVRNRNPLVPIPKEIRPVLFYLPTQYPRKSGIIPRVELCVKTKDQKTGSQRPICIHELIETVIHDDEEWKANLPQRLTKWELVFPKGESWGIMRITGYPDSPGPSQQSPWVDSSFGAVPGS